MTMANSIELRVPLLDHKLLEFAAALPPDPLAELLALGRKHFAALDAFPEARAFWWPRFARIASWFVRWEIARRPALAAVHAEVRGEIEIPFGTQVLRLSGRADRIERLADGSYAILDYKTGQVPTACVNGPAHAETAAPFCA